MLARASRRPSPQDEATTELVHDAARRRAPAGHAGTGLDVAVTGNVAVNIDFSDYLSARLPLLLRRRAGAVVPAADGRVPLDPRAAQGRGDEPAVDRRRLRRRRRRLPVGLGRQPHRHRRGRAHRAVHPDDDVRHRLRPVDGLRGVPALAASRRSTTAPATTPAPSPTAWPRRPGSSPPPPPSWCSSSAASCSSPTASSSSSASASPAPCSSTPPSSACCSCRPRWSCSATATGGCRKWLDRILPKIDVEGTGDDTLGAIEEAEPAEHAEEQREPVTVG